MAECVKEKPKRKKRTRHDRSKPETESQQDAVEEWVPTTQVPLNAGFAGDAGTSLPEEAKKEKKEDGEFNVGLVEEVPIDSLPAGNNAEAAEERGGESKRGIKQLEGYEQLRSVEQMPGETVNFPVIVEDGMQNEAKLFEIAENGDEEIMPVEELKEPMVSLGDEQKVESHGDVKKEIEVDSMIVNVPILEETGNIEVDNDSEKVVQDGNTNLELAEAATAVEGNEMQPEATAVEGTDAQPEAIAVEAKVIPHEIEEFKIQPFPLEQLLHFYINPFLERKEFFMESFVETQRQFPHHELHELLAEYMRTQTGLLVSTKEVHELKETCCKLEDEAWKHETKVVKGKGKCEDGKEVEGQHSYSSASLDPSIMTSLSRELVSLRSLVHEKQTMNTHSSILCRLQIQSYLGKLWTSSITPGWIEHVKTCLSILFYFLRKDCSDKSFQTDVSEWLQAILSLFVPMASHNDHLFLVHHMLRSPSRVCSSWLSKCLQLPGITVSEETLVTPEVDLAIAIMTVILEEVQGRDLFCIPRETGDKAWVLVTDDGEEDESSNALTESDILSLLRQLSFEDVICQLLCIPQCDGHYIYPKVISSEQGFLRLLSVATCILLILQKGLDVHSGSSFATLGKYLCRMATHLTLYVTDHLEFTLIHSNVSSAFRCRLEVEYDAFLKRSIACILHGKEIGGVQFLSELSYHVASQSVVKEIRETLSMALKNEMLKDQSLSLFYLLAALIQVAADRTCQDGLLIHEIAEEVFQVCFLSPSVSESMEKHGRDLLTSLAMQHAFVLSSIHKLLISNAATSPDAILRLAKELPWDSWHLSNSEIKDLCEKHIVGGNSSSAVNQVARMILSSLNWSLTADGKHLALPHKHHLLVALSLVRASVEPKPEKRRKLRNLWQSQPQNTFDTWAWTMVQKLHLHVNQIPGADMSHDVPYLNETEGMASLLQGCRAAHPLACYVALLTTSQGFQVPEILQTGLDLLQPLQNEKHHDALCKILYLLVPLFYPCKDSLYQSAKFLNVIKSLLQESVSSSSYVKNLILSDFPTPLLKAVSSIIETHVVYAKDCARDPCDPIFLWLSVFTSLPQWNTNQVLLYQIECIAQAAFWCGQETWLQFLDALDDKMKAASPVSNAGSGLTSLFNWGHVEPESILPKWAWVQCPWLALACFTVEEHWEEQLGIFRAILKAVEQHPKKNMVAIMKKVCKELKLSSAAHPPASLSIYRWAELILQVPVDCEVLPIIWQKFFMGFFYRRDKGSFGQHFFEDNANFSLLKRLKKQLIEARAQAGTKKEILQDILLTYSLWLEELSLHDANVYLPALPSQYQPARLQSLFAGQGELWVEFLDQEKRGEAYQEGVSWWMGQKANFKTEKGKPKKVIPRERILNRLQMNPGDIKAPLVKKIQSPVQPIEGDAFLRGQAILEHTRPHLDLLREVAKSYGVNQAKHLGLDLTFLEQLPNLYTFVGQEVMLYVTCTEGSRYRRECKGAATVSVEFMDPHLNEGIRFAIEENRREWKQLLRADGMENMSKAAHIMESIVTELVKFYRHTESQEAQATGSKLFYYLLAEYTQELSLYPPTRQLLTSALEVLGKEFISTRMEESERLFSEMVSRPQHLGILSPVLDLTSCDPATFLRIYTRVTTIPVTQLDVVFVLLSKCDLKAWLKKQRPKPSQRSTIIACLMKALTDFGRIVPKDKQLVFDIYCLHFRLLLSCDFPEHYGEILEMLLNESRNRQLPVDLWYDFLNCLDPTYTRKEEKSVAYWNYAQKSTGLSFVDVHDTVLLLTRRMTDERSTILTSGLLSLYGPYVEALSDLYGMMGHALIVHSLLRDKGTPSDSLLSWLWSLLVNFYFPWLSPLEGKMPWMPGEVDLAEAFIISFCHVITFLHKTLPAERAILSHVWEWYAHCYATKLVTPYVSAVVHRHLEKLPWESSWPTRNDIDIMCRVLGDYLPESHSFLASIFIQIPWQDYLQVMHPELPRTMGQFLLLLVQLSHEPNISNHAKLKTLFHQAMTFQALPHIEASFYEKVLEWFILSCDPRVILPTASSDDAPDAQVLALLQIAAMSSTNGGRQGSQKVMLYVRAVVRLLVLCSSKHKTLLNREPHLSKDAIMHLLAFLQKLPVDKLDISNGLLEAIKIVDVLPEASREAFYEWGLTQDASSPLLFPIIAVVSQTVKSTVKAALLESCVQATFRGAKEEPWTQLSPHVKLCLSQGDPNILLHQAALDGCFLFIHIFSLVAEKTPKALSDQILSLIGVGKVNVQLEPKFFLLFSRIMELQLSSGDFGAVMKTCDSLAEDRSQEGLLGVLGLGKKSKFSVKFRLACHCLSAFLSRGKNAREVLLGIKAYTDYSDFLSWFNSFISKHEGDPKAYNELVKTIVNRLFPQFPYLAFL